MLGGVPHVIEPAASGRATCRGCARRIERGELRLGERLPNPFAEGEMTLWFHLRCAAYKRPEPLLEALADTQAAVTEKGDLERAAQESLAHRRLPRIDGAERAASAKARCRACREPIAKDDWRVRLTFFEGGRFSPGGFVHLTCRQAYFELDPIGERLLHFSPELEPGQRDELLRALAG
jgi:hypothetical protein